MGFDLPRKGKVLIRADASWVIGAGHVMRTLALGQLLSEAGYEVHFATIPHDPTILDLLNQEGFNVHCFRQDTVWSASSDLGSFLSLASQVQPAWVVLDGYHLDHDYERAVKRSGCKLLRIDDLPAGHYYADVVLNQNYGAETFKYEREPYTQVLAGLRYALLRREFRKVVSFDRPIRTSRPLQLLVSLGGSSEKTDVLNFTIAQGLSGLSVKDVSVTFLVGALGRNMAEEMSKADMAIVSGGSTMWELIYMNVPFMAVALNEMQRDYLQMLSAHGICVDLGRHEYLTIAGVRQSALDFIQDHEGRMRMSNQFKPLMDRRNIGRDLLGIMDGRTAWV